LGDSKEIEIIGLISFVWEQLLEITTGKIYCGVTVTPGTPLDITTEREGNLGY
jgi:hypothetical protein